MKQETSTTQQENEVFDNEGQMWFDFTDPS
jgi:hypothetical protein